ncbi:Predicted N-acyltransferase [Rhizobiales bacterium GAS113]|nr:Predicted N-acyltransferase [Rhizobiales bacterium GAS113]
MSQTRPLKLSHDGELGPPRASRRGEPASFNPRSPALRVEWRNAASEIPAELWERCFPSPLEGPWLYATLEQSQLDEQFSFAYALVMRGDAVIAIAPVFTAILPISLIVPSFVDKAFRLGGRLLEPLRFQKTLFVGSPCSDEGSVGTVPGVTLADVAPTLQRAVWERARQCGAASLVWKDFPEACWPALRGIARQAGLGEAVSYPGTRILNIDGGFEAYLQRLTGNRRHNLRKKLRQSRSHVDIETEILSEVDDAVIEEVWGLFQNTYGRATTKFERLTRRFWEIVTRQPQSRLIVLRERKSRKAVAFMLVILQGRRAINKFIGIDYDLGDKAYLYFRLWEEFMRFAMSAGAQEVQSGQTGYRAKLDVGHELVPLSNFFRYRNPVIQMIASFVAKRISWNSLDENLERAAQSRGWRKPSGGARD